MKKLMTLGIVFLIILTVILAVVLLNNAFHQSVIPNASATSMKLTSTAFIDQGSIPSLYTCEGKNVSPSLMISDVPSKTASLVLLMEDPDAPVGIWDHWVVFDIDPTTTAIPEGSEPNGIHGKGSGGNLTYKGPCPPSGIHRYLFNVYALDTKLGLPEGSSKLDVVNAMNGHVIGQAKLVGTYEKQK